MEKITHPLGSSRTLIATTHLKNKGFLLSSRIVTPTYGPYTHNS